MWFLALFACTPDAPSDPAPLTPEEHVAAFAAPGPHRVGFRWTSADYTDPGGDPRTIGLAYWYPTDATSGVPAEYFRGAFESERAWADAPAASGAFPLIVFSHGHQAFAEVSSFLAEQLASHGAIVVAPEHTSDTTIDDSQRDTSIYYQRPADISAAIDAAVASDLPVDVDAPILAMGHSFGGYTVHALGGASYDPAEIARCATPDDDGFCSSMTPDAAALFAAGFRDPRIAAILSMAPGDYRLFSEAGLAAVEVPVLLMGGSLDPGGDGANFGAVFTESPGNVYARVVGFGHNSFTDFPGLMEDFEGLLDAERGFRIVDVYALAWWQHLLGTEGVAPILDGSVVVDDAVELTSG